MNKNKFLEKLNQYGWQKVKKVTKNKKGTIINIKNRKYNFIDLPHI